MLIFSQRSGRSSRGRACRPAGFTLIELMVVVSIMVLVTALILIRQSRFDSSTLLRSLAYSVALSVRQAQIYGSSVLGTSTLQANCVGNFNLSLGACYANAYGIDINLSTPGNYVLFADLNNDGKYEAGESIKTFTLNNGYSILDICATAGGGTVYCKADGLTQLDIVFRRPNPEACFSSVLQSGVCAPGATQYYSQAVLKLVNSADTTNTRSVTVTQTGEVQVCALVGC